MSRHRLTPPRPAWSILVWAGVTLLILTVGIWAVSNGHQRCTGITGPWC